MVHWVLQAVDGCVYRDDDNFGSKGPTPLATKQGSVPPSKRKPAAEIRGTGKHGIVV